MKEDLTSELPKVWPLLGAEQSHGLERRMLGKLLM